MAQKRLDTKRLLLLLVVAAGIYAYHYYTEKRNAEAEDPDTEEVTTTEEEQVITDEITPEELYSMNEMENDPQLDKYRVTSPRAKGVEIPAYLTDRPEEILQHEGFTISYNNKTLCPNWVAWVLYPARYRGKEERAENFQPDNSIRKGPIVQDRDYRGSGYTRGHMCPAGDCKQSRNSQNDCFLLSNMCPQTKKMNAGDWNDLEMLCRRWATRYDSIYIVCGPIFDKGKQYKKIGRNNKISVPEQFYKVVLRWSGGNNAEAIGFIYNNDNKYRDIKSHVVTVDSIEARTGINFFSKLPKHLERKVEARSNPRQWYKLNSN